jgi:hypothetical protein
MYANQPGRSEKGNAVGVNWGRGVREGIGVWVAVGGLGLGVDVDVRGGVGVGVGARDAVQAGRRMFARRRSPTGS